MPGYAKETVEAARRFIEDPMYMVLEDGTVWKRVGLPDAAGAQTVAFQVGPHKYAQVSVKLAVFLKHVSKDIPDNGDWRIVNIDGDVFNNAAENLKIVGQPTARRANVDATLAAQIRDDYANGRSPLQIAQEHSLTVKAVKTTLFGNSRRK